MSSSSDEDPSGGDSPDTQVGKDIHRQLSRDIDIDDAADNVGEDYSRNELRSLLRQRALEEVNTNRNLYREIVSQNLSTQSQNWDNNISKAEKVNQIDNLIDTSVRVWADNHLERFVSGIQESSEPIYDIGIKDLSRMLIKGAILQATIESVISDTLNNYGTEISSEVVNWFINNTPLTIEHLSNAIEALLRGMFGV